MDIVISEKPISFNGDMVRAILDGRKTKTRRIIKFPEGNFIYSGQNDKGDHLFVYDDWQQRGGSVIDNTIIIKPKYQIGDVLYVREAVRLIAYDGCYLLNGVGHCQFQFEADGAKVSIYTPDRIKPIKLNHCCPNGCFKELARLHLPVTGVRVERVQSISEEDCLAEGIRKVTKDCNVFKYCIYDKGDYSSVAWSDMPRSPIPVFASLWDSCYGEGAWDRNGWNFVFDFEKGGK